MATNTQLKFYKVNGMPASGLVVGAIYFDKLTGMINVATSATAYERFGGRISETEWNDQSKVLSITKNDGTKIALDFSDIASAKDIAAEILRVENLTKDNKTAVENAQADVDAIEEALGSGFSKDSTVATQLSAVKATADAAAVKATVDAELVKKADKTQVATDINAAKEAAIAAAAEDAATKANTAEANAKADTKAKDEAMDARVKVLEAAIGEDGSVEDTIAAKIEDLDADVTSAEGTQVRVQVVEVDGKITEVKVTESATFATDQALADEIADRAADELAIGLRIDALDAAGDAEGKGKGRVTILEEQVRALNAATHFEGKVEGETFEGAIAASDKTFEAGDIVIYGNKEYIFDGTNWIELGDTTAESGRISALESLVGSKSVGTQIDEKIAALSDDAKSSEDANLVKVTVSQANGNVTGVSLDDSKLDQAISDLDGKISANTAAHEANAASIKTINETTVPGINNRLDGLDGDVKRIDGVLATLATSDAMTQLTNRVSANEAAIERLDGEQTTQNQNIAAADAKGAQGISDAAAALAEAQSKVKSVSGDADVNALTTDHAVSLSLNKATAVAQGDTKAVTAGAVYDALCWVEFN